MNVKGRQAFPRHYRARSRRAQRVDADCRVVRFVSVTTGGCRSQLHNIRARTSKVRSVDATGRGLINFLWIDVTRICSSKMRNATRAAITLQRVSGTKNAIHRTRMLRPNKFEMRSKFADAAFASAETRRRAAMTLRRRPFTTENSPSYAGDGRQGLGAAARDFPPNLWRPPACRRRSDEKTERRTSVVNRSAAGYCADTRISRGPADR